MKYCRWYLIQSPRLSNQISLSLLETDYKCRNGAHKEARKLYISIPRHFRDLQIREFS